MTVRGGQRCTVCAHPRVSEIDAQLSVPETSGYTRLASTYGLQKDAVRRHKASGHVRGVASGTSAAVDAIGDLTAVEVLEQLQRTLQATDTAGMSPRELNIHRDTQRRVAVDLAKYQVAVDREGPAQRELRALEEMVEVMDTALEGFPEARRAVATATHEWKARRGREGAA